MEINWIDNGSPTSPAGYKATGITAGLKRTGKPDLALLVSDIPATVAGTFTSCLFAAAPVQVSAEIVKRGTKVRGVVVNSGNANACTGEAGLDSAKRMCAETAKLLGCDAAEILVSSTGRIGVQMPLDDIILPGIAKASAALTSDGGNLMAEAIMTTDTVPKACAVQVTLDSGKSFTIGGTTKGAGMIAPWMKSPDGLHATMLCYITTDAVIEDPAFLQSAAQQTADRSFNRINIDGDMSTNDTMLIFANGAAGVALETDADREAFIHALNAVTERLAREMVLDGEGVTKFVKIKLTGAKDEVDARKAVNALCNSLLCKTAWFGGDPNWGRIAAALGYSGACFDPAKVSVDYDDQPVIRQGQAAGTPELELAEVLKKSEFTITIDLGSGDGHYWMYTNDISYDYVKINAEYYT